jgi:hypothetical protein
MSLGYFDAPRVVVEILKSVMVYLQSLPNKMDGQMTIRDSTDEAPVLSLHLL